MAVKKEKKEKSIELTLWDACNKLRGSMAATQYMYFVLGLVFLKFASLKFEDRRNEILNSDDKDLVDIPAFYQEKNVFYLPKGVDAEGKEYSARYDFILSHAKDSDIGIKIDKAFELIEKENKALKGCLPIGTYSKGSTSLTSEKFASLITTIDGIHVDDKHPMEDLIGRIYQYFINKFAIISANEKGEFYTPDSIVSLITELIEPYEGSVYDPCCGTGGMFIQSLKFIKAHQGNTKNVSIYGQENIEDTWKLAKMNLAIRGISCDLGDRWGDTFSQEKHKDKKMNYIIANPPFNLKDWRGENSLLDDPRWEGYDKKPPVSNANYAWILHMISKLSYKGVAGFLLANGALGADGDEKVIRKQILKNDKVEAIIVLPREMFYYTDISVTLWIVRNNKDSDTIKTGDCVRKVRDRKNEILFMDLRTKGHYSDDGYKELTPEEVDEVRNTYFNWQSIDKDTLYKDIPEFCKSMKTSDLIDGSLVPSKYIEFIDHDLDIDYDKEMTRIQSELKSLMQQEKKSQEELENAFKGIGYDIN